MLTTRVLVVTGNKIVSIGVQGLFKNSGAPVSSNIMVSVRDEGFDSSVLVSDCLVITTFDDIADNHKGLNSSISHRMIVLCGALATSQLSLLLEGGVAGVVSMKSDPGVLLLAIKSVSRGSHFIDPLYSRSLTEMVVYSTSGGGALVSKLTKQEYVVATELSKGSSNRTIANRLGLSEKSVKAYMTSIFSKLSVRNRVEAALLIKETILKRPDEPVFARDRMLALD